MRANGKKDYSKDLVYRQSLVDSIVSSMNESMAVIVSAPDGFGKTTLLRQAKQSIDSNESYVTSYHSLATEKCKNVSEIVDAVIRHQNASNKPVVVLLDDISLSDTQQMCSLFESNDYINEDRNISFIIAGTPSSTAPFHSIHDVELITTSSLMVSPGEYVDWVEALQLYESPSYREDSLGIPSLIFSTRRAMGSRKIAEETLVSRLIEVLIGICDEELNEEQRKILYGSMLLGSLKSNDFELLDFSLTIEDIRFLKMGYPFLFGSMLRSKQERFMLDPIAHEPILARITLEDQDLVYLCAQVLVKKGFVERAVAICELYLDEHAAQSLAERAPEELLMEGYTQFLIKSLPMSSHVNSFEHRAPCSASANNDYAKLISAFILGDYKLAKLASSSLKVNYSKLDNDSQRVAGSIIDLLAVWPYLTSAKCQVSVIEDAMGFDSNTVIARGLIAMVAMLTHDPNCEQYIAAYRECATLSKTTEIEILIAKILFVFGCLLSNNHALALAQISPVVVRGTPKRFSHAVYLMLHGVITAFSGSSRDDAYACNLLAKQYFDDHGFEMWSASSQGLIAAVHAGIGGKGIELGDVSLVRTWSMLVQDGLTEQLSLIIEALNDAVSGRSARAIVAAKRVYEELSRLKMELAAGFAELLLVATACVLGHTEELKARHREVELVKSKGLYFVIYQALTNLLIYSRLGDSEGIQRIEDNYGHVLRSIQYDPIEMIIGHAAGKWGEIILKYVSPPPADEIAAYGIIDDYKKLDVRAPNVHLALMDRVVPPISICMFGRLEIAINNQIVPDIVWGKRKAKQLFSMLALNLGRNVSKDVLMAELWPDMDGERASNNLYVTLSRTRDVLEEAGLSEIIISAGDSIRLDNSRCVSDIGEFMQLRREIGSLGLTDTYRAKVNMLELCTRLEQVYSGDLVSFKEDPLNYFLTKRTEYQISFCDCMAQGTRVALELEKNELGLLFARTAYQYDSRREDVICALIRAQHSLGLNAEAITLYFEHVKFLAQEYGVGPSAALKKAYEEILLDDEENNGESVA